MLGSVRRVLLTPVLTPVLLAVLLVTGCSRDGADCTGVTYGADLDADPAADPIGALNAWLAVQRDFADPPTKDWSQHDAGEGADTVVLTSEAGQGWWVSVRRVGEGWLVHEVTDDADGCAGRLS